MWVDDLSNPTIAFILCIWSERWWVRRKIPSVNLFQRVDRSLQVKYWKGWAFVSRLNTSILLTKKNIALFLLFNTTFPTDLVLKLPQHSQMWHLFASLIPHFLRVVIVSTTSAFASVIFVWGITRGYGWVNSFSSRLKGKSGHLHGLRSTIFHYWYVWCVYYLYIYIYISMFINMVLSISMVNNQYLWFISCFFNQNLWFISMFIYINVYITGLVSGKNYRKAWKPHISLENLWFPANFPLNQSTVYIMVKFNTQYDTKDYQY